ncbi:MAG: 4a-hydroxytetrahydrobiopterin dehydratase [Methylacidiphilales bacterium]|nr:4a-hydroxytetrahydrobiopterin dehydratase [Candidatus Methylacidiphilales bacterium]
MPQSVPQGWTESGNALTRTIRRADFVEALALVVEIGKLAEAANHHPDIDIRYRTVQLSLSTHDAGHTITEKDFALAQEINDLNEEAIRFTRDDLHRRFQA